MSDHLAWFRLYSEAVDDEKLRLLAFEDRWHFVAVLCCKCQGILDEQNEALRHRKVAVKLGVQVRELGEIVRRLSEVGLIDANSLEPCAWDRRQFVSDNSTARVQRHRAKKKQEDTDSEASETLQERFCSASVTPPDTETETDNSEPKGSVSSAEASDRESADFCPHEKIIQLYHERLPELPPVVASRWRGSKGAKYLRARWREDKRHQSLDFWGRFFAAARTNAHWMGGTGDFRASLAWLVQRENFDKVISVLVEQRRRSAHG